VDLLVSTKNVALKAAESMEYGGLLKIPLRRILPLDGGYSEGLSLRSLGLLTGSKTSDS